MRRSFIVSLEMPEGVTPIQMAAYIEREVACGRGGREVNAPLLGLDGDTVSVEPVADEDED